MSFAVTTPSTCASRRTPREFSRELLLGMPHLAGGGVNLNWLVRECGHLHWWSIGDEAGMLPSELCDREGDRVLSSVVACLVSGRADRFVEDDAAKLRLQRQPSARNGWLSGAQLTSDGGAELSVELLTAFAKRSAPSNRSLTGARMRAELETDPSSRAAARAQAIRARGATLRRQAGAAQRVPQLSVTVSPALHFNGVGLVYFANFLDMFAAAEDNALTTRPRSVGLHSRFVAYFGNADAGERIEIFSEIALCRIEPSPRIEIRSTARRSSDQAVIAVADAAYTG